MHNINDIHRLASRYRNACSQDLSLALTFLRHPVAGRSNLLTRLDHSFSLPDGYVATIRSRRVRVPLPLAVQLKKIQPELRDIANSQLFLFGVAVRITPPRPMIVSKDELEGTEPPPADREDHDYARSRAVAEALHWAADYRWVHDNGSDPAFAGFRFGWVGTYNARPLPSPSELFAPHYQATG